MASPRTACSASPLGRTLAATSSGFHPDLAFRRDPTYGVSVFASRPLPPGTSVVSCPLALAITPAGARQRLGRVASSLSTWTNHELVVTYLALHRLLPAPPDAQLDHQAYVDSLPLASDLRTPLYFSDAELQLLGPGLNLHGATLDRAKLWKEEWAAVVPRLTFPNALTEFTWETYLWASSMLSSRAFSSALIDGDEPNSTPVLFPGVDTLNHRYGQKVSWLTDVHGSTLSVVLGDGVAEGEQVFNSYGPKSNEELLLGYGFVTPSNPGDVVALLLAVPPSPPTLPQTLSTLNLSPLRHFVPRSGILPPELLAQLRLFLASEEEKAAISRASGEWPEVLKFLSWENELEVLDIVQDMLEAKLGMVKSPPAKGAGGGIRSEVRVLIDVYRQGQIDVLVAALDWARSQFDEVMARAREAGVSFNEDDGQEGLSDDDEEK